MVLWWRPPPRTVTDRPSHPGGCHPSPCDPSVPLCHADNKDFIVLDFEHLILYLIPHFHSQFLYAVPNFLIPNIELYTPPADVFEIINDNFKELTNGNIPKGCADANLDAAGLFFIHCPLSRPVPRVVLLLDLHNRSFRPAGAVAVLRDPSPDPQKHPTRPAGAAAMLREAVPLLLGPQNIHKSTCPSLPLPVCRAPDSVPLPLWRKDDSRRVTAERERMIADTLHGDGERTAADWGGAPSRQMARLLK